MLNLAAIRIFWYLKKFSKGRIGVDPNFMITRCTLPFKTMETSTYGYELVAARITTELAIEYRNTLRFMGVKVDGPTLMLGDNKSVVLSCT